MSVDLSTSRVRTWMSPALPLITPRTTIATALRLLREHRTPALPVCDGERFVGLVTEKALLRLTPSEATTLDVYELREVLDKLTVARAVEPAAGSVSPETSLAEAAALMSRTAAEVVPVLDGGRLTGLLHWTALLAATGGDAVHAVAH
jgi:acetoin utilization protein AcuB